MTDNEDLDNIEEVEDLNNDELHQQIEPKVGMKFNGIEELYSSIEHMQRPLDFQFGKNPQRRMQRELLEV